MFVLIRIISAGLDARGTVDVEAGRQRHRAVLRRDRERLGEDHAREEDVEDVAAAGPRGLDVDLGRAVVVRVGRKRDAVQAAQQPADLRILDALLEQGADVLAEAVGVDAEVLARERAC